jgi:hypothetical protein
MNTSSISLPTVAQTSSITITDQDTLVWVEGVTDLNDLCTKEVSQFASSFIKLIEQLNCRPFIQIHDWKIYKLDYFDHSYNQYYFQINQHTNKVRMVITFKRYQKDKVERFASSDSEDVKSIKNTANVIQITHYKKSMEVGTTLTTEEFTKTTKISCSNFILSL